ncbi:transporter substrate-binding domain-containing protein (plasmid) [Devosia neptuniae]|uniref:Transporter substrate-binding domain-containing protein n=1 Tax=Devosia neptuniae TaxID=191302 RepID=A0ABY6C7D9_9HYPH|nr:transporter substrate-binding domain-containing protein [Devosia neptuniae]UXN68169.1 transporter substrate-binding domain-containing protein [Devosia neptuniae]
MIRLARNLAFAAAATLVMSTTAMAQAANTLDEIVARGKIIVGISLSTPPYGMTDADLKPAGFDVAIANLIARDLGVELEILDQVSQSRIPNLTSNKVDIIVSSLGITAERAKTIMYTNAIYVDEQMVIAPASAAITSLDDLVGKRVGVTRSTTNDTIITEKAVEGTNIQRFDDDAATNQALFAGQVDAIVSGVAAANAINAQTDQFQRKFAVRQSPMGIGVRRGDADLHQWLNTEIMLLWNSGEIQAAQQQWLGVTNPDLPRF